MAASALLPVFHLALMQGAGPTLEWIFPLLKSMGSYLLGVFVYANQYPEKLFPGRFDHLGSSHQLWHLCVLGGVYFHFTAALSFWERRYEFGCPSGFGDIAPMGGLVALVVKEIQRLNAREASLSTSHSQTGSWHEQYKDSAHIFAGGLPYNLTEGDVICVFSQFGEIAGINLVRDKDTGKSKGFAFIKYVDQRSTILAVDNLNSAQIGGRTIRVDHVQNYKVPKVFDADGNEIEPDEDMVNNAVPKPIQAEDSDGDASSESEVDDTGIDLDDPMREYLLKKRRKEAKKAKRKAEKEASSGHGGRSESKAERKARKELKKAAKKDKEAKKTGDKDDNKKIDPVKEDAESRKEEQPHDGKDAEKNKDKMSQDSGDKKREVSNSKEIEAGSVNKPTAQTTPSTSRRSRSRSPVSRRSRSPAFRNRSRSTDRYKSSSSSSYRPHTTSRSRERRRAGDEDGYRKRRDDSRDGRRSYRDSDSTERDRSKV
ncbi:hypothetical protein BGZ70_007052 [Mortierella alpina]|uniref:RRM domain-containing protein n=1 Tax=Mortierella alpina TaxID=64518 RepID=A0A9P6JED6_MORAP|nr:hypothetical protein BGZ70_007052 [Mortierella alpina]